MWANGDQTSTNGQWWPMHYGYQFPNPNQDASADWASRAALWAQQRQAQEEMAKQHQQYYATMQNQHPASNSGVPHEKPALPTSDGTDQVLSQHNTAPPLPPGESDIMPPAQPNDKGDNLETVAMEDEPLDSSAPEHDVAVTRLDYNHGQTLPLPEAGPPPIPGMQTFDHNHGFTPAPGTQATFVPAQRFDYGHQSVSYEPQPAAPVAPQWYDYNHVHGEQLHMYEQDRHHTQHTGRNEPVVSHLPPALDYGSMSEVKKKALPLWIREGLEKMERQKQKKQEQELKKSLNSSTSSLPNIAGYDHGNIHSPVPSPERPQSDEEPENKPEEIPKEIKVKEKKSTKSHGLLRHSPSRSLSPKKSDSSDEEVNNKSDSEKQQELLIKMRQMLTEVLLSVTNEELHDIAKESFNEALTAENRHLRSSGGLKILQEGGALGVGHYGSDSESNSDSEEEEKTTERHPSLHNRDPKHTDTDETPTRPSRSPRRDQSDQGEQSPARSSSPVTSRKPTRAQSTGVSTDDESDLSVSHKKKKHRSKHRRKQKSLSASPKRHNKHKNRRSRSRSRTPKKRNKSKRDRSKSRSPSNSRSSRKTRKHSRSRSRSPSDRKHRNKSRSRSPSSRRKRSRSRSPRRKHGHRGSSSSPDRHREGKRRHERRSRSRSRSPSPRKTKRH